MSRGITTVTVTLRYCLCIWIYIWCCSLQWFNWNQYFSDPRVYVCMTIWSGQVVKRA